MGGWPFREFSLNPKCVVYSTAMVSAYWYLPCKYDRNAYQSAAAIAIASYVSLAWYDHYYNCSNKMRPGVLHPVTRWIKPPIESF